MPHVVSILKIANMVEVIKHIQPFGFVASNLNQGINIKEPMNFRYLYEQRNRVLLIRIQMHCVNFCCLFRILGNYYTTQQKVKSVTMQFTFKNKFLTDPRRILK